MTTPQNTERDPLLDGDKRPSVSFKTAAVGDTKRLNVQSLSRAAQQTDYDTGKPAFWPSDTPGVQGNPKMAVVFDVEYQGEELALWAPRPSSMLTAIIAAQKAAGQRIGPGGVLAVTLDSIKPSTDRKKEGQKIYTAVYTPPAPGANEPDALNGPSDEPPF
jgi:hypothetical protein